MCIPQRLIQANAFSVLSACSKTLRLKMQVRDFRSSLAPTGSLRIGLYLGSPDSFIPESLSGPNRGLGFELGRAFATYLNLGFELCIFEKNADVLQAAKCGEVDFVFANATATRAEYLAFAEPLIFSEQSYLVSSSRAFSGIEAVDQPSCVIGVSAGSTTESVLPSLLRQAKTRSINNLTLARTMLMHGELDAFATNKGILFELQDQLPSFVVLPGAWGVEHIAVGIPKNRAHALIIVQDFCAQVLAEGFVGQALSRAAIRGARVRSPQALAAPQRSGPI